jgi:flagellar biosynthetic protein FliR
VTPLDLATAALTALALPAGTALSVFLRVGAAMAVLPALGEQAVPTRIKLALSLAFTAIVAPAVPPVPLRGDVAALGLGMIADASVGLVLGLSLRLAVHALQIVGAIVAQLTALAQIAGNPGLEPQPAVGNVLMIAALALACAMGLPVRVAEGFIRSYDVVAASTFPAAGDLAAWGVAGAARTMALALGLATPFVVLALVYNLALGAINRALPQLMVALIGAPAVSLGALALLAVASPLMLEVWRAALEARFADPFGAAP